MANPAGDGFDLGSFANGALQLANTVVSRYVNPDVSGAAPEETAPEATKPPTPKAPAQSPGMLAGLGAANLVWVVGGGGALIYFLFKR